MRVPQVLRQRRRELISAVVLAAGAAALVAGAVLAEGVPVRHVDLNDGGIWVTSDHDGLFGRLNKPAGALDAAFYPPGGAQTTYALDVVQDGKAVAAWDRVTGRLLPVDVAHAVTVGDQGVPVGDVEQVQLRGGTVAVLDPATGKVWATRVDPGQNLPPLSALDPSVAPVATVGAHAALAVGTDGAVHAVSAAGRLAEVRPAAIGGFQPVAYGQVPALSRPEVTAVGDRAVVLDPATGRLTVAGNGSTATVDGTDEHTVLQAPGPAAEDVIVATGHTLLAVHLADGTPSRLGTVEGGDPAPPVRLDGCVHAAWSGGGYYRSCDGQPAIRGNLKNAEVLARPVFRVNRDAIVLNDLSTGAVWDLTDQRRVDDWSSVRPPPQKVNHGKDHDDDSDLPLAQQKPKAVDDILGARPGRTTLLYLLDNDSDPSGSILSITRATTPDDPRAQAVIAADGQSVALSVPAGIEPGTTVHFRYTTDDGHASADAGVTVQIRGRGDNKAPALRPGYKPLHWTVPAGRQLSMPVLADWRDFDGDPVALVDAAAKAGTASTTPDGLLVYTAPGEGGVQHLTYRVSDGLAAVPGASDVTVPATTVSTAIAATTQPDVARGQVGQPITVRPLDNDLPGADPANPSAKLAIAGALNSPADTTVITHLGDGSVVLTASKPGPYLMQYKAAYGNAPFAAGQIRVDVAPVPSSPKPPIAMPDSATLRGQLATTVDVLANDVDPAGAVLAVQHATPADPRTRLSVAVVDGRWLRIRALNGTPSPDPQIVQYTVTDAVTAPVTGQVTVTRLPDPPDVRPAPQDDAATVRAGDAVTVAVLDNDTNPGGAPMALSADVPGAPGPGRLVVRSASSTDETKIGRAYVSGNQVRYVPPATLTGPMQATVEYVVHNNAGDQATGHVRVTVLPLPGGGLVNHPPAPLPVESRAIAGQNVRIGVPATGADPDGDSITVTGLGTAPRLGRVVRVDATSLTYQAYPTSAGTDTFTYRVVDRFGAVGEAAVRVAVATPGVPQPPVAVDDEVTAAPGARLHVDVLANDLYRPGDPVRVAPLSNAPPGVGLAGREGPIDLTVPAATGKPFVVVYSAADGISEPSSATLTVRVQPGYDIPPVVYDAYPPGDGRQVTVDVAKQAIDPDGSSGALTVTRVFDPAANASRHQVVAPVTDRPYTVAYEVRDARGAAAVGLIHVPAPGAGAPYATPGKSITVGKDGSTRVHIADFVTDPAGKTVRLTTVDKVSPSPGGPLKAVPDGTGTIVLSAHSGYNGPGALTFEVTDGSSITDLAGRTAMISVPVQVVRAAPVLHCPAQPLPVVEGGQSVDLDITSICRVWTSDPGSAAGLRYRLRWKRQPSGGVNLSGDGTHVGTVTAAGDAVPGDTGVIAVGVQGGDDVSAELAVQILAAAPPSVTPITVDGVKAGETVSVDVARYMRSQLRNPHFGIVSATQSAGPAATVRSSGTRLQLTPQGDSHGTVTVVLTVTDVAGASRTDRQTTAQVTLHVLGPPGAPGTPAVDATVLSRSVGLSWTASANNGAPIDRYEVDWSGGSQSCAASPCLITGLTNGDRYTFTVRAHNLVGWSRASGSSAPATPDTVPGAVTGLTADTPQDHALQLHWAAPANDGSAIQRYDITWTGGGRATSTGTTATATGLDNDVVYTFTVIAVNAKGVGEAASVQGQSAGTPATPSVLSVGWKTATDRSYRTVTISWSNIDPNGPGPTTYAMTRDGTAVCTAAYYSACDDDRVANDGARHSYAISATNAAGNTSPFSPPYVIEAAETPDPITGFTATATGTDGQAVLRFDVPASHGASNTVTCTFTGGSCGTWTYPVGGQSGATQTINGLPNGQNEPVSLRACNGSSGSADTGNPCDAGASAQVVTYGPLKSLSVGTSASGTDVNYSVSVDPNGKPATVTVQTSKQTQTFTTGVGQWSWAGSDNVGYSSTDTITVTVSDSGRAPLTQSKQQSTSAPPPPPPTVSVSKGARCGGGGGAACPGGACSSPSCALIHVTTANFGGNVTCTFNSQHGPGGFFSGTWGANQSKDSGNWYGYPGEWVSATCGGVTGQMTWS